MVTFVNVNGILAEDPQFKNVTKNDGTQVEVCQLSIKSSNYIAGKKNMVYFNVTVWPGRADNLVKKLEKGSAILVTGQLYLYTFTNSSGDEDSRLNINMHSIQFPVVNEIKSKKRKLNNTQRLDDNSLSLISEQNEGSPNEGETEETDGQ